MSLNETLPRIIQRLNNNRVLYEGSEAAVRLQVINPILRSLDWDPEDPEGGVIQEESTAEGRPDYTLMKDGKRVLFIEAKKLSVDIYGRDVVKQLRNYCSDEGVRYGLLTNGAAWSLYRTFEIGVQFRDRVIWKADLENEIPQAIIRKLRTISKPDIDNLEEIVKKLEILDIVWEELKENIEDLSKALVNVLREYITIVSPEKHFKDEELIDFLEFKIKEMLTDGPPPPPPPVNGEDPPYIVRYRAQLENPNCLISKILNYIEDKKRIKWYELKSACVEEFGCKAKHPVVFLPV